MRVVVVKCCRVYIAMSVSRKERTIKSKWETREMRQKEKENEGEIKRERETVAGGSIDESRPRGCCRPAADHGGGPGSMFSNGMVTQALGKGLGTPCKSANRPERSVSTIISHCTKYKYCCGPRGLRVVFNHFVQVRNEDIDHWKKKK
jgi:hypothetical protein